MAILGLPLRSNIVKKNFKKHLLYALFFTIIMPAKVV